ncbi:hypothetical protein H6P81_007384 [Aristolochia fimbriata]|uniref:Uncharacterized protein n=1 Tax=Aristolochia fimbriata TaxID=158543 RepID=A0AAV7F298_ARIFI|nr:hypothetical protein H6P81_007384 [Aristolochia fimbriata]
MSLVIGSMEVAGGPTVAYRGDEASSPVACVGKGQASLSCLSAYLKPGGEGETPREKLGGFPLDPEESSSIGIGEESSSEEEEEEEEVQSNPNGGLASLDALEESLPIKRGLSSHFSGKSKSFACFSDIASQSTVKELAKAENPFNKRRRILMACKSRWSLKASLPLVSSEEEPSVEDEEADAVAREEKSNPCSRIRKLKTLFDPPRCFSLTDLRTAQLSLQKYQ